MCQIKLLFVLLLFAGQYCYGQFTVPEPVPPTPEAGKIVQQVLTPPNFYTGTSSISIPLYTINAKEVNLPISINYNTGGIKAAENATWVGLGWSLSTGGVISRNVKSFNDFVNDSGGGRLGYCYDPEPVPDQLQNWTGYDWLDPYWHEYMASPHDTEPDVFTYSFLNSSGEFVLSKLDSSNEIEVVKTSINTDKILFDKNNKNFTVVNDRGIKGIFAVKEYVLNISGSNGFENWSACEGQYVDILQSLNEGKRAITSWYLSEIILPSGRKINFNYDIQSDGYSNYFSISSPSWGEIKTYDTYYQKVDDQDNQNCSRIISEHVYLSSISSSDFEFQINFNKAIRDDIEWVDPSNSLYSSWLTSIGNFRNGISEVKKPQKLTSISIKNTSAYSTLNLKVDFFQTYFSGASGNSYDNLRLRLDSVKIADQVYQFEYYTGLPNKSTLGLDYWGFYNGKDGNLELTPVIVNYPPDNITTVAYMPQNFYYQTDNRKANFNFGKAGLLYKVTYPTKGSVIYEYESNEYKLEGREAIVAEGTTNILATGLSSDQSVTLDYKGYGVDGCTGMITLRESTMCKDFFLGNNCTIASEDINATAVELLNPDGTQKSFLNYDFQYYNDTNTYTRETFYNNTSTDINISDPGIYTLKAYGKKDIDGSTKYYGDISLEVPKKCLNDYPTKYEDNVYNQIAGGARIISITLQDAAGKQLLKKAYEYSSPDQGNTWSSGRLMSPLMDLKFNKQSTAPTYIHIHSSGSVIDNSNAAQGSHIGYSFVREKIVGPNETIGLTDYYFYNEPNYLAPWSKSNQVAMANISFKEKNGSLTYNSNHKLLSTGSTSTINSTSNKYQFTILGQVNAMKVNWASSKGLHSFYKINRGVNSLVEAVSTTYSQTDDIVSKNIYSYNTYNQQIKITEKDQFNNIIRETELKHPVDYTNPGTLIQNMITQNVLAPVIEQKNDQMGSITSEGIKYKIYNNMALVDTIFSRNTSFTFSGSTNGEVFPDSYEEVAFINDYDNVGNVLEVGKRDGVLTSYIWGYNLNYPVAKIENASRKDIEAILGAGYHAGSGPLSSSSIDLLKSNLPNALITIYTYNPGIGIATVTDPNGFKSTYEYDTVGRLKIIKDKDNNIVKLYDYNYMIGN